MNITVKHSVLKSALTALKPLASARPSIPILQCVLIRAGREGLTITGTDIDTRLTLCIDPAPHGEFAVAVNLRNMADALSGVSGVVNLSANDGGDLVLKCDGAASTIKTMSCADFAAARRAPDDALSFAMPAADLAVMIEKTQHAISSEDGRYYLNGIFLHSHEGALRAVATDGHRLALRDTPLPDGAQNMPPIIIHQSAVKRLGGALKKQAGEVNLTVHGEYARFEIDGATLITKPIDGHFPDYAHVIPSPKHSCLIPVKQLIQAAKRAVSVTLKFGLNRLDVSAGLDGAGDYRTLELPVTWGHGLQSIKFNAKYLCDTLSQVDGDDAVINIDNGASPALFTDTTASLHRFVLMPMRR